MTIGLVIFSRIDSRRLPGKALRDLAGRPLLGRVIDQARCVPGAHPIIVATSDRSDDDPIAEFARGDGVKVFRGSTDDVLGRAIACAKLNRLAWLVRICGDSPFVDAGLAGHMIGLSERYECDLITNVFPRTYPKGTSIEVINVEALYSTDAITTELDEREHMTRPFYRNADQFRIRNVRAEFEGGTDVSLAVDTPEDLARSAWIIGKLGAPSASLPMMVSWARQWRSAAEEPGEAGHRENAKRRYP